MLEHLIRMNRPPVQGTSRIKRLAAKPVKQLLYHFGFTTRRMQEHRANFIITFHLVSTNDSARFEKTIRFLAENFAIVRLDEFVARTRAQGPVQKEGMIALTFDDGLRNHGAVVYTILKRLRVPATFYICADLINRPGSVWTWEIHSRLQRLGEVDRQRFFDVAGVSGELQKIVDWMKTIPVDRREQIESEIHAYTPNFEFTPSERDRFELMSWQDIQNLDPDLITIGSHTATHIDLPQATPERLDRELSSSKEMIESRLNRKVAHFAYPNGSVSERVLPFVRKYYSSAVTTRRGVVKAGDNPLLLNRIHGEFDLPRFSWDLAVSTSRE